VYITNLESIPAIVPSMEGAKGVTKQVPLSKDAGSPNYSFRVFNIEPGGHTPFHKHPFEHMNYVIEGRGTVVSKDREYDVKKGDFALILPGEMHQYKNASTTRPLVIICAVPKEYE
jgi:quercetin dioxygenase-like cupin family protein